MAVQHTHIAQVTVYCLQLQTLALTIRSANSYSMTHVNEGCSVVIYSHLHILSHSPDEKGETTLDAMIMDG